VPEVSDENTMVTVPSFPIPVGKWYGQIAEIHCPETNLSSVPVNVLPTSGPDEMYHCAAPSAWKE